MGKKKRLDQMLLLSGVSMLSSPDKICQLSLILEMLQCFKKKTYFLVFLFCLLKKKKTYISIEGSILVAMSLLSTQTEVTKSVVLMKQ